MPTEQTPPAADNQQTTITNPPTEGINPTEKRIKDLSGKVELTSKERDAAILKAENLEKQAKFASDFLDVVIKNPAANEHRADIEAKVLGGYSMQDATYAVLGPLGKLGNQEPVRQAPVTGGSASTIIPSGGVKQAGDMNSSELRQALLDAQNRGDLFLS